MIIISQSPFVPAIFIVTFENYRAPFFCLVREICIQNLTLLNTVQATSSTAHHRTITGKQGVLPGADAERTKEKLASFLSFLEQCTSLWQTPIRLRAPRVRNVPAGRHDHVKCCREKIASPLGVRYSHYGDAIRHKREPAIGAIQRTSHQSIPEKR